METIEATLSAETIPTESTTAEQTETTAADTEPSEGLQEPPFTLPVKFNKQEYQLSLEDAPAYAQKGMKFDTIEPMLDRLRSLAQQNGKSMMAYVQGLCGECADINERLAEEYDQLRQACPDVDSFDKVPEEAVQTAIDSGMPLLYAFLQHFYAEQTRIARAQAIADGARERSVGGQRGETHKTPDPAVEAMLRGVWG